MQLWFEGRGLEAPEQWIQDFITWFFIFFEHSMIITFVLVSLVLTHYLYAYTVQIIHLFFRCCLGLLVYCKKLLVSKKEVWCVVILLYPHRMLLCLESVIVKIARQDVIHVGEKLR